MAHIQLNQSKAHCTACFRSFDHLPRNSVNDTFMKDVYVTLTGLKVHQDLWFCFICDYLLRKFFRFRAKCIESNNLLTMLQLNKEDAKVYLDCPVLNFTTVSLIALIDDNFSEESTVENDFDNKSDISHNSVAILEVPRSTKKKKKLKTVSKLEGPNSVLINKKSISDGYTNNPDDETKNPTKDISHELDELNMRAIKLSDEEQLREIEERRLSTWYIESTYKCERCASGFSHKESYETHIARHDPSYGDYECEICGIRFDNVKTLWTHRANHRKRFECVLCGRRIKEKRNCGYHVSSCPNRGTDADTSGIACDICGKVKSNEQVLRSHRLRAHFAKKKHSCHLCAKMFVNIQALREHLVSHSGERPFACDECDSTFTTRASLRQHKPIHSTFKIFYCARCDISFASQRLLSRHLQVGSRHITPDKLRHQCPECCRRYSSAPELRLHVDATHRGLRRFACAFCPRRYAAPNSLAVHLRKSHPAHAPERRRAAPLTASNRYICDVCGSAFSSKSTLTCHMRRHTGERPLECSHCGARFAHPAARYTHIKLVHLKIKRNKKTTKHATGLNVDSTSDNKIKK